MQIRQLDPNGNPADLAAALPAFQAWGREFMPGFPDLGQVRLRHSTSEGYEQRTTVLGAFADETATAAEGLAVCGFELTHNLDLAWADFYVPAEARVRGIDALLFREAVKLAADAGRKRFATGMPESSGPASLAARHGGRHTDTAIRSALDLSTADRARYEAWAAPSGKNSGYTLVRWNGHCPDELASSYCTALDAMADQPLGEFEFEWAKASLERMRFNEQRAAHVGTQKYVLAAVDPDGEVAGFHTLAAYPDEPEIIEVWSTGVARPHRGHGLGLRIKAAASLWVLEDRPNTRWACTYNNDGNERMLQVNATLGYRAVQKWPSYEFAVVVP